jgi:hypothetical protein
MTINIKLMRVLVLVGIGFPIQICLSQQLPPKAIKVYLLGVDSDLKGEFSQVAPELTGALRTAFSSQSDFFTLLDRTNLDALVKANQLEGDLDAVFHGAVPSSKLARIAHADIAHADGFIRSELRNGADGAVLSVALVKLDSEIPWSTQIIFTLAKWLSNDTQKSAASYLAQDAAYKLFSPKALPNVSAAAKNLERRTIESTNDSQPVPFVTSAEIEQPPGLYVTESYRLTAGEGSHSAITGKWHKDSPYIAGGYDTYPSLNLSIMVESLSKSHFHFAIQSNSCYLSDEKGNTWTQDAPDSSGSYYPDSIRISSRGVEIQPNVRVRTTFSFLAGGDTTGTLFTLVCSEESPTRGRQIVIRGIKVHESRDFQH